MEGSHPSAGTTEAEQEAFEENQRLALVCDDVPEHQALIRTALQELGFKVHIPSNSADAIERMRKNSYGMIVLDEEYQESSAHDNQVLKTIHSMAMPVRRYIFVALLGKQSKTFDNMMAFGKSVNAAVNVNDVPQIKGILRQGMAENDQFYRVFREVLREAGRR